MCTCMWERIETIVAAASSAKDAAVDLAGQRQADAQVDALREQGHAFKRGEAAAIRKEKRQAVAAEMATPEGEKLATLLGHIRRHK